MRNQPLFGLRTKASDTIARTAYNIADSEPTQQQLDLAKSTFVVNDTSRTGFKWITHGYPFAVMCGNQSFGCYATRAEALHRIMELKTP